MITPTTPQGEECRALLDILFRSSPRHSITHHEDFVAQLQMTERCDVMMPFMASARRLVQTSLDSGLSADTSYVTNKDLVHSLLRRQYMETFGTWQWIKTSMCPYSNGV